MRDGAPLYVVYICIQLYYLIGRLNKNINNNKKVANFPITTICLIYFCIIEYNDAVTEIRAFFDNLKTNESIVFI